MGLDNGILIKRKSKGLNISSIPNFVKFENLEGYIELAYWRKCWGIRNEIIKKLHMKDDEYERSLDREDIPAIIKILYKFLSKEYWDENADSIWEFEDQVDNIIQCIINLKWLYSYMENNDIEIIFYDSY